MAYQKRPTVNDRPTTVNARPSTVNARPGTVNRRPAPPAGGNTTNMVGVGASAATAIAVNNANNKVQVGA